jgi:flagellar biosynthesis protein FlhF
MREAMNQAKSALGAEAVILSTRELADGTAEMVAALDTDPGSSRNKLPAAVGRDRDFLPDPESLREIYTELHEMRRELKRLRAERSLAARSTNQWDHLMEELKDLARVMGVRGVDPGAANDAVLSRLVAGGVEMSLARSLVEQVNRETSDDRERLLAVGEQIERAFDPAPSLWGNDRRTVAALVGPTGVGKTTTIAKIAAQAVFQRGLSVGLIAADTYRIAAVDQLRTYGDLMGLPCVPAAGADELSAALKRMEDKDLVLVDTSGGNPWADETLRRTDELLSGSPVERHLCVSATMGAPDLRRVVQRYSESGLRSLIVTKLDEARTMGGILSTVWSTDYQIAHVTNGQDVPGDIEVPNPSFLRQAVLG